ncbi:MAG: ABC transporter permease [Bacteroidales bacterium]|nr:ABC transporter permease [Bacteroidales bacterium]
MILLWVQNEWSYDRHFKNADDLYRITEAQQYSGGEVFQTALTPNGLAPALREEYPEIIRSSRYESHPMPLKKGDDFLFEVLGFVDKDFLEMFDISFVRGDRNNALNGPYNILITEEMAIKYFGNEDPLGKTLSVMNMHVFTVTGIIKSLPSNSHIQFDLLAPFEFFKEFGTDLNAWGYNATYSYVELHKGIDSKLVDNKIKGILKRKIKDGKDANAEFSLQSIKKIHLYSSGKYTADISGHVDIIYVRILSLIAVFILIIACINFMNLSTAQSAMRAREIGVRKVAGANKRKIFVQFIGESLLIVFVAHAIAMIFVELLLPGFNTLIGNSQSTGDLLVFGYNNHNGKQLDVNYQSAGLYIGLMTVVLFCGFLAGSYPAFYLSSLQPLNIIKGDINKNPGNAGFRRVLVIFQFSLSVLLIICTLVVGTQFRYMQNKKLGFNKENLGHIQFGMGFPKEVFKKDLLNNPDILSVTIAHQNPLNIMNTSGFFNWEGKKEGDNVLIHLLVADEEYAKSFQLEIKEGRFFSSEYSTDSTAVVINEKAAEILGFKDPIGQILSEHDSKFRIIGVVNDFHFKSLHAKIEPLIMFMRNDGFDCFIKMKPENTASTVDYIRKTFKSYNLPFPLEFNFFNDEYDNLYRTEQRMGKILGYFSLLAIIISCLGLIGLSSFMTERRTKEIGIRKANGAKSFEIFYLLSKEYLIWVLISIIIASPIAWYVMNKWLQNFAYHISLDGWVFAQAGFVVLFIAFLTVSWQSYKTANKNPVEALRYE